MLSHEEGSVLLVCHVASEFEHESQMLCTEEWTMQIIVYCLAEGFIPHFHVHPCSGLVHVHPCSGLVHIHLCAGTVPSLIIAHYLLSMAGGVVVTRPRYFFYITNWEFFCRLSLQTASSLCFRLSSLRFQGGREILWALCFFDITGWELVASPPFRQLPGSIARVCVLRSITGSAIVAWSAKRSALALSEDGSRH
jgi:hypothetical protein